MRSTWKIPEAPVAPRAAALRALLRVLGDSLDKMVFHAEGRGPEMAGRPARRPHAAPYTGPAKSVNIRVNKSVDALRRAFQNAASQTGRKR
jgi:hypothetical protein